MDEIEFGNNVTLCVFCVCVVIALNIMASCLNEEKRIVRDLESGARLEQVEGVKP